MTTVIGVVHKTGLKGIKLTVTVTPNRRVRSLLAHGRTFHATATLTFKSAVGVKPYVKTWRVTLRVRKRH